MHELRGMDGVSALTGPGCAYSKQMEVIVRQYLFDCDMSALRQIQYPDPNMTKAPTPDSANSMSADRRRFTDLQLRIYEGARNLKDSWSESLKHLSYEEIQKSFPETYAARSKVFVSMQPDMPKTPGKYKHPFMLPIHRNTIPLEFINYGRRFLEEWATKDGHKYKSKLNSWLSS